MLVVRCITRERLNCEYLIKQHHARMTISENFTEAYGSTMNPTSLASSLATNVNFAITSQSGTSGMS